MGSLFKAASVTPAPMPVVRDKKSSVEQALTINPTPDTKPIDDGLVKYDLAQPKEG